MRPGLCASGRGSFTLKPCPLSSITPVNTLAGEAATLAPYKGHVLLIVNTASKCGLTPQYEGLEKLYSTYKHCGFDVLGFPANDFAGQEPGTSQEIAKFCETTFNVTFPMFEKVVATGPEKSPIYEHADRCTARGAGRGSGLQGQAARLRADGERGAGADAGTSKSSWSIGAGRWWRASRRTRCRWIR